MANPMFFIMLRLKRKDFINGFREWLGKNSIKELKGMVLRGEFPALQPDWITNCASYKDGIKDITFEMWFEFIAEANPELADYLNSLGVEGGRYLGKLREYFLDLLEHPEKLSLAAADAPKIATEILTCSICGKSWPATEEESAKTEKCPYCGEKA
ncbi:MAG: hypothetical protein PHU23_01160 [Dehalococcoidales bacterium]|nr:hypothetical protein [Dehalococcoidales bacterium]